MILTTVGRDKINTVLGTNTPSVEWKHIAFGDGDGIEPIFTEDTTELVNEVWRGDVLSIWRDETNSAWVYFQTEIPPEDGNFYTREIGIFDADGDLVAVGSFPTSFKPVFTGTGVTKTIHTKVAVQVENSEGITFIIDPSVVMASQAWVTTNFSKKEETHIFNTSIEGTDINFTLPSNKEDGYVVTIYYTDTDRTASVKVSPDTDYSIVNIEVGDTADIDVVSITQFVLQNKIWYIRRG